MDVKDFKELLSAEEFQEAPKKPEAPPVIIEAMDNTPSDLMLTGIEKSIIEHTLQGLAIPTISYKLGVPESYIRNFIRKPKVKDYLKELKEAINELDQLMISSTLRKMVSSRVERIEEDPEADFGDLSKRDTLDIIRVFSDITNNIAKNQKEDKETSVFANIYQQIINN